MLHLFANNWGWIAVALAIGLAIGFVTTTRAEGRFSGGWATLAAVALLGVGFLASAAEAFSGRAGLWLDASLLLAAAYALGVPLGGGAKLLTATPAPQPPEKRPNLVIVRGNARKNETEKEEAIKALVVTTEPVETPVEIVEAEKTSVADQEPAEAIAVADAVAQTADNPPEASASAAETVQEPIAEVIDTSVAIETSVVTPEAAKAAAESDAVEQTTEDTKASEASAPFAETIEEPVAIAETPVAKVETIETSVVTPEATEAAADVERQSPPSSVAETAEAPPAPAEPVEEPAPLVVAARAKSAPRSANGSGKALPGAPPEGLPGPRGGKPDDLSKIKGVGPKSCEKLHALGVFHYDQIAAWTPEQARWVGGALGVPGRVERGHWVAQAKDLAGGGTQAHPK
jgi:predicted flap endonuclease-1-like 5' DNA nuclease